MQIITFFCVLVVIIAAIAGVAKVAKQRAEAARSDDLPVEVTVLEASFGHCVFERKDKSRIFIELPYSICNTLVVGDRGLLTYHKDIFKSWKPLPR